MFLMGKLRAIPAQPGPFGRGLGIPSRALLSMAMTIIDEAGVKVGTLDQLLHNIEELTRKNACLQERIKNLSSNNAAQGGIVLDGLALSSEPQALEAVLEECPDGGAFEMFLDVMSLFCCNPAYEPAPGWAKFTRAMEDDYSPTARKVVSLYYQTHCAWYTEGTQVVAGKVLAAFKEVEKWNGRRGMDGRRHDIETPAAMAAEISRTWVGDKLPSGGKLAPLALKMINCSVKWIHMVHKHLDTKYSKLTQQHILAEEALILLSEEVIIMYHQIHQVRRQCIEFMASKGNKAAYMAWCIRIKCQVHRVMQVFVKGGLKNNPAILTAFVHFLTKQTGGNVASGVGGQIKALTDTVATLQGSVSMATSTTKEATQVAKEANTRATRANTNADAAKNAVNSIYSKNSTLKR